MSKVILLGSDPEIFTKNAQGKIGSVAGMLGCSKWAKLNFSDDVRIQEDNVLVEFDTNPQGTFESFSKNLSDGIAACDAVVKQVDHELAPGISSHIYTMDELNSFNKSVFEFGCEPDYNALTGMVNPKPTAADPGLRTAGGHVHIGYRDLMPKGMDFAQSQAIVGVMCDYHLGLASLLLDKDDRRRELYGKAGSVRLKDYGIEYRTLSNFWIFNDQTRKLVWDQAHKAFQALEGEWERLIALVAPEEVQRVINANDKAAADKYLTMLKVM